MTCRHFLFFIILLGFLPFQTPAQPGPASLLGKWRCQMFGETVSLVFQSDTMLEFDGEAAAYRLAPGVIVVQDEYELTEYGYNLDGNTLQLSFPEGFGVTCTRLSQPGSIRPEPPSPLGGQAPERDFPAPQTDTSPTASAPVSSSAIGNPSWGFKFRPPEGWKWQADHSGALLGHDSIPGMILVSTHRETSLSSLTSKMQEGLQEEGVSLKPSGGLRRLGDHMLAGEFSGVFQGQQVKGRGIGTLSPHGGGAYILGVTTPEKYDQGVAAAADAISSRLEYFKVDVSELVRHFAGMWASYSGGSGGGTLLNYHFYPDGSFSDASETSYSSQYSSDGWSTPDTSLGAVGVSRGSAHWVVRGNLESGQIIITRPDGTESYIDYQVFVEKGQIYRREYLFDGRHFSKQKDY